MKRLFLFLANNILVNQFLIAVGKDNFIKKFINNWTKTKFDSSKTLQENVGFSHSADVDLAVQKVHDYVKTVNATYLNKESFILDIGCGVGLYLNDFESRNLFGTDLNNDFLIACKQNNASVTTHLGDYLFIPFENLFFDCICCISVIEYIAPSCIHQFFAKIYAELKPKGVIIIQYPHALTWQDKWYADLSYISYTPEKIESTLEGKFEILIHEHSFDKRKVRGVDEVNHSKTGGKSFTNGMILIARKK